MIAAISHTKKINDDYLNHYGLTLVSSDQNHRMSFGLKQEWSTDEEKEYENVLLVSSRFGQMQLINLSNLNAWEQC